MTLPHLYVAGPMATYPDHNFPAFKRATAQLREAGYLVTSPHEISLAVCAADGSEPGDHPWEFYLRNDLIEMLRHAYGVAVLPGWENSRGAQLEVHVAKVLQMSVWPLQRWLLWAGQLAGRSLRPEYPFPTFEVHGVVTGSTRSVPEAGEGV